MSQGIYLADGSFQSFVKEDLQLEIASRQNASFMDYEWLGQLPDPDPILRKSGDDPKILADLLADEQVTTAIVSRKNRVLNAKDFGYSAASFDGSNSSEEAQFVFENLTKDFERININTLISSILDAPFFGLVPLEIMWESTGSWWRIKDIVARPYYWFAFDENNKPFFKGDYYGTVQKRELPAGKFVLATYNATYDNPYGTRLLSRCLWAVSFKHGGLKFYAKFIEKYGMPWVIGKASQGATKAEKREIAANLARMVEDAVAVIPKGSEVDLIAPNTSTTTMFEDFLSRQDRTISKIIMGQTLTLEMEGKNNSQAAATTHHDVANDIAEADKSLVCETMNEIAWLYTLLNAGENVPAPVFTYNEPKDLQQQVELDTKLHSLGVRFNHQHFIKEYGLKADEFKIVETELPEQPEQAGISDNAASFSTGAIKVQENHHKNAVRHQLALDSAIKELLPEALQANQKFLNELLDTVNQAQDFEEMEYALIEALGSQMEMADLEDFLAQALTKAECFGIYSAEKEHNEKEHPNKAGK